jgi:hypothetical protein
VGRTCGRWGPGFDADLKVRSHVRLTVVVPPEGGPYDV